MGIMRRSGSTRMMVAAGLGLGVAVGAIAPPAAAQDQQSGGETPDQPNQPIGQRVIESPPTIMLPPPAKPRSETFGRAAEQATRLSPQEIERFRRIMEAKQDAMYGGPAPETYARLYTVSLDTGAEIPTVEIAPGYVSSIVFVDAYGNPWPIEGNPAIGNPSLYAVTVHNSENRNVLTVSAKKAAGASNLSVSLLGQGLPVNIQLRTNRERTCLRGDMQIEGMGPKTDPIMATGGAGAPPATPDDVMMQFVDGVPPEKATPVPTSSRDWRAWVFNEMLYLRTKKSLISPGEEAVSYGTAGLRVYRMRQTPLVLYSDQGATKSLRIDLTAAAAGGSLATADDPRSN